jgi:hypothetical protein
MGRLLSIWKKIVTYRSYKKQILWEIKIQRKEFFRELQLVLVAIRHNHRSIEKMANQLDALKAAAENTLALIAQAIELIAQLQENQADPAELEDITNTLTAANDALNTAINPPVEEPPVEEPPVEEPPVETPPTA